jgi:8-amino-7-oxononanoate synthase
MKTPSARDRAMGGRWAAGDVRSLWLGRLEGGDDGSVIGSWSRRDRTLTTVSQHHVLRQASTLAERALEQGARPKTPVVVDCSSPRSSLLGYLAAVLAGSYPVITPVELGSRSDTRSRSARLHGELEASATFTDRGQAGGRATVTVDPDGLSPASAVPTSLAVSARPEDPLHLQLTSGTTSRPRPAVVTHANALANCAGLVEAASLRTEDTTVSWLPLYHDMGLVGMALLCLLQGRDLHLLSPFDFLARPADWLRAMSDAGAAVTAGPTFGYRLAVDRTPDTELAHLDLSALRIAACGAEPVRADVLSAFARRFAACGMDAAALQPCYGLAEATLAVTYTRPGTRPALLMVDGSAVRADGRITIENAGRLGDPPPNGAGTILVSAGTPLPQTEMAIVEPATGDPRALEGLCGEVVVRSRSVSPGHWQNGGVARREGPWLRTGDIGLVWQGELYLVERASNVLIRNGQNHAARPLEAALAVACGVDPDAVVVVDRDIQDPSSSVTGVLEVPRGAEPDRLAEVAAAAGRGLELPLDDVVVLRRGGLPRTTSGKKQHATVRQGLREGTLPVLERRRCASRTEPAKPEVIDLTGTDPADLAAVVAEEVARVSERIAPGALPSPDDLLHEDLGIDSLAVFEVAVAVEERTGRRIDPDRLTEIRTVADLVGVTGSGVDGTSLRDMAESYVGSIPQVDVLVDQQAGRTLSVAGREVADFASCNYLGLDLHADVVAAIEPLVREWGVHPSWTRAVASPAPYRELERRLAELAGVPDVLVFGTITLLHLGVLPALAGPRGALLVDRSAHRSIQEAAELAGSRGAEVRSVRHGDLEDLEDHLRATAARSSRIICLDGVYSMSGDVPDLPAIFGLAEEWDATVYIDDAHGFGVLGEEPTPTDPYGRGGGGAVRHLGIRHERLVYVAGLSKAYSSLGAFVSCRSPEERQRFMASSTMVFSGPVPTASLASALAGLDVNEREGDSIRRRLHTLTVDLVEGAVDLGLPVVGTSRFPIITVRFGSLDAVTSACRVLWDHGILVTPSVFPAAPLDQGGVRFSVTAANTEAEVDRALAGLVACRRALGRGTTPGTRLSAGAVPIQP